MPACLEGGEGARDGRRWTRKLMGSQDPLQCNTAVGGWCRSLRTSSLAANAGVLLLDVHIMYITVLDKYNIIYVPYTILQKKEGGRQNYKIHTCCIGVCTLLALGHACVHVSMPVHWRVGTFAQAHRNFEGSAHSARSLQYLM